MMMKKTHLTAALLLIATGTIAGRADAAVIEKTRFKGTQVATSFSATADITCPGGGAGTASTNGFVTGSSSISKATGSVKMVNNGVTILIFAYSNSCKASGFAGGDGTVGGTYTPPNRTLREAELDGTTTVQDFDSGVSVPVTVDIEVEGTGPITSGGGTTVTRIVPMPHGPITITITHSSNSSREGTSSGTITLDGVVFAPSFSSTTLSFSKNSEIDISR